MRVRPSQIAVAVACCSVLLASCGDRSGTPTGAEPADHAATAPSDALPRGVVELPEPFTVRASIQPYFINQMPELMLRSERTADLAIQRLVTQSGGGGGWHTHPGPSFAIVEVGAVRITRYDPKSGCTAIVYGPGQPAGRTYYEVAGEVHIATVVSTEAAVEYKVRFNTPPGAPFGAPVTVAPTC
jgi:hypothetical protein